MLDLTQTIGACPLDITRLAPDFMVTAGYKWQFCPYGVAYLYVDGPEGRPVAVVANVENVLKNANFADDVTLAPMDVVYVPRSRVADVNKFMEQYIYENLPPEYFFYNYRR